MSAAAPRAIRRLAALSVLAIGAAGCSASSDNSHPHGDASHRPPPVKIAGTVASAALAAPILRPADLGPTWRYGLDPGVTQHAPTTSPSDGSTVKVGTTLGTQHWNGTAWPVDQIVDETATHYRSTTQARQAIRTILSATHSCNCVPPAARITPSSGPGLLVWNRPDPGSTQAQVYILEGKTEFYVMVSTSNASNPASLAADQIIRVAIRRIERAARS